MDNPFNSITLSRLYNFLVLLKTLHFTEAARLSALASSFASVFVVIFTPSFFFITSTNKKKYLPSLSCVPVLKSTVHFLMALLMLKEDDRCVQ